MYEFRRKFGCSGQVAAIDESQHPDCNIRKRVKCEPIFTQRFLYQWRRRRMRAQEREASALRGAIVIRRKPTACALAQLFFSSVSSAELFQSQTNHFKDRPAVQHQHNETQDKRRTRFRQGLAQVQHVALHLLFGMFHSVRMCYYLAPSSTQTSTYWYESKRGKLVLLSFITKPDLPDDQVIRFKSTAIRAVFYTFPL